MIARAQDFFRAVLFFDVDLADDFFTLDFTDFFAPLALTDDFFALLLLSAVLFARETVE
jgi:hypothetical protein